MDFAYAHPTNTFNILYCFLYLLLFFTIPVKRPYKSFMNQISTNFYFNASSPTLYYYTYKKTSNVTKTGSWSYEKRSMQGRKA